MQAWRDLWTLPPAIWRLALATLVNRTGTMALPFLALYLTQSGGYSPTQAGAILAGYGVVAMVVGPIAGRVIDHVGAPRVMLASLVLTGLLQLAVPLAHGPAAMILLVLLWAMTAESFRPASLSVTAELVPVDRRREGYALIRLAINLGMSVGPAVGGLLAAWDFRAVFVVDGLTSLGAAAVLHFGGVGPVAPRERAARPRPNLFSPLRDVRMRRFLLGNIVLAVVSFQGESSMALYLVRDLGLSTAIYGLMFTLNTVMIVAMEIPLTRLLQPWRPHRTLALGAALTAVGFGALGLVSTVGGVMLTVVLWTFGEMVASSISSAYVAELAPEEERGSYMGLYVAAFSIGFAVAPVVGMWSLDQLGRLHWAAMAAVGMVAAGIFLRNPRQR